MNLYGLIGRPLKHSFSKAYFAAKFERESIANCHYENFELADISEVEALLKSHPNLLGFNITIPYKKDILPFLTTRNSLVEQVGACNCVKVTNGKLHGYNTDVIGFKQALQPFLKAHHTHALVLGTGGSSGAVRHALSSLGIAYVSVSRQAGPHAISYAQVDETFSKTHTLIINTTPLGMYPNMDAAPALPYHFFTSRHLLFDLIYNPEKTLFLQKGEAQGAAIANGHQMLLLQAEESWRIWNS